MQTVHEIESAIAELESKRQEAIKEARKAVVEKVAESLIGIERQDLEFVIQAAAEKCGVILTVELVTPAKPKAPAKYRNTANPEQTWNGLGKRPAWFEKSRESEFLIGNAANPA